MLPILVFDLNGTLLDTEALAPALRRIFGRKLSVEAWFTTVLQHSMATSLAGDYRPFDEIAATVLEMSAMAHGVQLRPADADRVRDGMKKLPPFSDVKKALAKLQAGGYRLAVLTNSSRDSLKEQLRNAGLEKYFEEAFSVDMVRRFKPAPDTYRAAAHLLGVDTHRMLMVAAHGWDLLGAARAGCRTALLTRPGKALWPGAPLPQYIAPSLNDLADGLLREASSGTPMPPKRSNRPLLMATGGILLGTAGCLAAEMMCSRRLDS